MNRRAWSTSAASAIRSHSSSSAGFQPIAQRDERAAAALDEQGRPAAEQDDIGAGDASRACARPLRPRQDGSVRLRRIGGGEHERLVLVVLARPQLPEALDRAAERELGAAETLDEVAAPAETERLERLQLAVDRAVAALDPLSADTVARDDPLPLEQELGECAAVLVACEEAIGERPSALRRRVPGATGPRESARPPFYPRRRKATPRPERLPGVVRHLARPHEIPERREGGLGLEPRGGEQVEPELGARRQCGANRVVYPAFGRRRAGGTAEHGGVLAEEQRDAVEPGSDPHDLAGRAELVELFGAIAGDAPRQHLALPERDRQRERLERDQRLAESRPPVDPMPARQEAAHRRLLDGLDLAAERRERRAPEPPEHLRVAPLALAAAGTKLAADELLRTLERAQLGLDVAAEALVRLTRRERTARAREARDQRAERLIPALEERRPADPRAASRRGRRDSGPHPRPR